MKVLLLRGFLYLDAGQNERATEDLEKVVRVQPWKKQAHHKISEAYRRLGDDEAAAEHRKAAEELTRRALELLTTVNELVADPGNAEIRRRAAELYEQLGQPEEAQRLHRGRDSRAGD